MSTVKKTVQDGKGSKMARHGNVEMHRELMRLPNSHQVDTSNQYNGHDNDDFISSESDRQLLLIKYFILPLALICYHIEL